MAPLPRRSLLMPTACHRQGPSLRTQSGTQGEHRRMTTWNGVMTKHSLPRTRVRPSQRYRRSRFVTCSRFARRAEQIRQREGRLTPRAFQGARGGFSLRPRTRRRVLRAALDLLRPSSAGARPALSPTHQRRDDHRDPDRGPHGHRSTRRKTFSPVSPRASSAVVAWSWRRVHGSVAGFPNTSAIVTAPTEFAPTRCAFRWRR